MKFQKNKFLEESFFSILIKNQFFPCTRTLMKFQKNKFLEESFFSILIKNQIFPCTRTLMKFQKSCRQGGVAIRRWIKSSGDLRRCTKVFLQKSSKINFFHVRGPWWNFKKINFWKNHFFRFWSKINFFHVRGPWWNFKKINFWKNHFFRFWSKIKFFHVRGPWWNFKKVAARGASPYVGE